jgi:hypothetical protein
MIPTPEHIILDHFESQKAFLELMQRKMLASG